MPYDRYDVFPDRYHRPVIGARFQIRLLDMLKPAENIVVKIVSVKSDGTVFHASDITVYLFFDLCFGFALESFVKTHSVIGYALIDLTYSVTVLIPVNTAKTSGEISCCICCHRIFLSAVIKTS